MRTKSRTGLDFLVPVAVAGLFAALSLVPAFRGADSRVYDLLLHVKPAIAERQDIRLIDIDDTAIEKVGTFPWSRDIMADGLILMREMGARTVMFDIEYVDPSPRGVNADLLEKALPETLASRVHQRQRERRRARALGPVGTRARRGRRRVPGPARRLQRALPAEGRGEDPPDRPRQRRATSARRPAFSAPPS